MKPSRRKRVPPPPPLAPEDAELFRRAVADAKPLPEDRHARVQHPRPTPKPRRLEHDVHLYDTLSDAPVGVAREPGEALSFSRPGLQRQVLRQLRRGGAVEAELDLHGLVVSEARRLLASFLVECRERGVRCVRIIHGKGLRSEAREGVLKGAVASWLAQWDDVLAYREAPSREGGSGAVTVLLKAPK